MMRQLTYVGRGAVEWRDAEEPVLGSDTDALVRPLAIARCDLDVAMVRRDLFPGPFAVGHECMAEVIDVGAAVVEHHPGDRVLVPFQVSCGHCEPCQRGHFAACRPNRAPAGAMFGFGHAGGGHGGALADVLRVPAADHMLIPAPAGLDAPTLATLPDNVVDGYRCVRTLIDEAPGADVLVVGGALRSIGLYAVTAAVSLGAASVRYIDRDEVACAAASRIGAASQRVDGAWPRRFEAASITVDASGEPGGLLAAINSTAAYGHCTVASLFFEPPPPLPLLEMYTRGITVHTSRADSRRYLPEVAALVAEGAFDPGVVGITEAAWDDAAAAWLEPATKLVVVR